MNDLKPPDNYEKKSFFALTFFLSTITFAQPMGKNFIEVTGKAETEIIPDEIYLRVIISEKDTMNSLALG